MLNVTPNTIAPHQAGVEVSGSGFAPGARVVVVLICTAHLDWASGAADGQGHVNLPLHPEAQALDAGVYTAAAFQYGAADQPPQLMDTATFTVQG